MADAAGDRLSSLPDDILHRILSLLPSFDEAARTSLLARRWRLLWSSNTVLHFSFSVEFLTSTEGDSGDVALARRIVSVVDECLVRASAPVLVSLLLPLLPTPSFPSVLSRWLRFAANHCAAEIVLHPVVLKRQEIVIPSVIFDCSHLCSLKVDSCLFPSIPSRVLADGRRRFAALKTLFMYHVGFVGTSLGELLTLCPNVERLALSSCKVPGGIAISSSTLKFFAVYQSNGKSNRVGIVSAPRLQHLVYSGDMKNLLFTASALPELEEATILFTSRKPFKDKRRWRHFASSIGHVKRLSVNCWFYQFALNGKHASAGPREPMCKNLKELHSWPVFQKSQSGYLSGEPFTGASVLALFPILRDCPLIEKLCVHRNFYDEEEEREEGQMNWMCMKAMGDLEGWGLSDDDDPYQEMEWVDPLNELENVGYALPHLKTLKVIEYSGMRLEQRLVEFVLDKSVNLRSVIIYYVPDVADDLGKMRKLVNAFPKASADVRISMSALPDRPCSKDNFMISLMCRSVEF